LADARGSDFLEEVKRGIGHRYAERHASVDRDRLGPAVEITIYAEVISHLCSITMAVLPAQPHLTRCVAWLILNVPCAERRFSQVRQYSFMLYGFFDRLYGLLKAGKQI
jgi:hypothetical protein